MHNVLPSNRLSDLMRTIRLPTSAVTVAAAAIDGVALICVGLLSFKLYTGWTGATWAVEQYPLYLSTIQLNAILTVGIYYFAGLYKIHVIMRPRKNVARLLMISWGILIFFVVLIFALKASEEFSRGWVFIWGLSNALAVCGARWLLRRIMSGAVLQERLARNVVIVGSGLLAKRLIGILLESTSEQRTRVLGIFDEREVPRDPASGESSPSGNLETLIRLAREERVDEILIALPWKAEQRILDIVTKLASLPVSVRLSPENVGLDFRQHSFGYIGGVLALSLADRPLSECSAFAKRCFDVVLSLITMVAVAPLMLLIAVLIKLDSPGSIFFRQNRLGYNNNVIEVLKFRTLYFNKQDVHGSVLITKNDPRVTRVGRILRRTSLDELPQLLNVLRGDMSLVGPRPHPIQATAAGTPYEKVVAEYSIRHKVKPGITGWAQINGWRGETDTTEKLSKRVEYDIWYVNNWSFLLDVIILVRTLPAVVIGKGAY